MRLPKTLHSDIVLHLLQADTPYFVIRLTETMPQVKKKFELTYEKTLQQEPYVSQSNSSSTFNK